LSSRAARANNSFGMAEPLLPRRMPGHIVARDDLYTL
jgi:hypothetical protein